MDRQTLRDWVHRYNAEGLAGLADRAHPAIAEIINVVDFAATVQQMKYEIASDQKAGRVPTTVITLSTDGLLDQLQLHQPFSRLLQGFLAFQLLLKQ